MQKKRNNLPISATLADRRTLKKRSMNRKEKKNVGGGEVIRGKKKKETYGRLVGVPEHAEQDAKNRKL